MKKKIVLVLKKYLYHFFFILLFVGIGFLLKNNREHVRSIYSPGKIYVRIMGNIKKPGVYQLFLGATLKQLVDKAGGLSYSKINKTIYNPELVLSNGQVIFLGTGK